MKALIKIDFEKWLISQLTKEGSNYYFMMGARKVYVFFEGQDGEITDTYVRVQIIPSETSRPATGIKYHTGNYKLFLYGINALLPDQIADALSTMLDEKIIEVTAGSRIETGLLSTNTRGNKFYGSSHYENVTQIPYHHWES